MHTHTHDARTHTHNAHIHTHTHTHTHDARTHTMHIYTHTHTHTHMHTQVPMELYAQYCHKHVEKKAQTGTKKGVKKPTIEEIAHAKVVPCEVAISAT